jgi:hypothetical protein
MKKINISIESIASAASHTRSFFDGQLIERQTLPAWV